MERKKFIKTCCLGGLAIPVLGFGITSCSGIYYAKFNREQHELKVARSEFQREKDGKTSTRKFVLVKDDSLNYPICLYFENNHYHAVLLQCTHRSCELSVGGGIYTCPCHGAEFSIDGTVLEGPAEQNLKTFTTHFNNEFIYIEL